MTLPKKPRELGDDLIELRAAAAQIGKEYGPAYDYAYGLRRSGDAQAQVVRPLPPSITMLGRTIRGG